MKEWKDTWPEKEEELQLFQMQEKEEISSAEDRRRERLEEDEVRERGPRWRCAGSRKEQTEVEKSRKVVKVKKAKTR